MPPVRRYIRLTAHTTLQTLIFLDDPSDLNAWLLHPVHPALPRIVDALRELILPKLREERERQRKGGGKKAAKGSVKDTVVGSDFEVNVFFRDGGTRHDVLSKQRFFLPKREERLRSNSARLLGDGHVLIPNLNIEDDEEDSAITVEENVPSNLDVMEEDGLQEDFDEGQSIPSSKRRNTRSAGRQLQESTTIGTSVLGNEHVTVHVDLRSATSSRKRKGEAETKSPTASTITKKKKKKQEQKTITIGSDDSSDGENLPSASPSKEDKKAFVTKYDGSTIYGKVLYLLVKRLGGGGSSGGTSHGPNTTSAEGIMEEWMFMSQAVRDEVD